MTYYDVTFEVPVTFIHRVKADNEDDAREKAEFPGVPYLGEHWDESGEPDITDVMESDDQEDEDEDG